jgi:tRNA(Ile)-lysidine synthase
MTLLNWLHAAREALALSLVAAHVNYGLRAEASEEERQLVKLCQHLQIPLEVAHYQEESFSEATGRRMRYDFFKEVMSKQDCSALVTAHHKNDNVETFIMREIRGSRLFDLAAIKARQKFGGGELIRPLLIFEKSELDADYYFEDTTNASADYFRNRVRNDILPLFLKENPKFTDRAADLMREVALSRDFIREQMEKKDLLQEKIDLTRFRSCSEAGRYFLLQLYLSEYFPDFQPSQSQFLEMLAILERPQQYRHALTDSYQLVKTADSFYISTKKAARISTLQLLTENPNDASFLEVALPADVTYDVRSRQAGDRLMIHGLHKKLKHYFINEKVALADRESPLIAVGSEIFALPVLGLCSDLSLELKNDKIKQSIWVKPLESLEK